VPYDHWNIPSTRTRTFRGLYWQGDRMIGNEMYDLRFYAGCKRQPQTVHKIVIADGWDSKIHLGPRIAASYALRWRNRVRSAEREYNHTVRGLWNAGEDVDDLLEPADSRHGAILWDIW
jgi:hypothetical protein